MMFLILGGGSRQQTIHFVTDVSKNAFRLTSHQNVGESLVLFSNSIPFKFHRIIGIDGNWVIQHGIVMIVIYVLYAMNVLIRYTCWLLRIFYYFACLFHIFYILTFVGKIFMYLCKTGWQVEASNKKIKRESENPWSKQKIMDKKAYKLNTHARTNNLNVYFSLFFFLFFLISFVSLISFYIQWPGIDDIFSHKLH